MQFQKDTNRNQIRQRRIYYQENTPESETGEMIYTDPNGNQLFSPFHDSPEHIIDINDIEQNNNIQKTKSVLQTVRNDLKGNPEIMNMVSDQPFPSLVMNINRQPPNPRYERTPQTINIGSSRDDYDYNIRTLNSRKSPNNMINNNDEYLQSPYEDDDYQPMPRETQSQRTGMH